MKADILAEPELANWRACELGNMAVDGWTLLHAAARYNCVYTYNIVDEHIYL